MSREVLLIEDDANYRMSIAYLLGEESYRFVEANSPEEGIAVLEANPQIRVILLDLSFGHGSGTAVLDHIKERSDDYRVIVLTAHDELLRAERAGDYDIFNYLPKAERSSNQAIRFSVDQAFKDLEREHLNRKIRFLLDVQRSINSNHDTRATLDLICQAVRSTVGAYTCHIRVYDFGRGDYHLAGFAGPEEKFREVFERPRAKGDLFSGSVVEEGKAKIINDLQSSDDFRRFRSIALGHPGATPEENLYFRTVRSVYIVPISTGLFEPAVDAMLNVSGESVGFFLEEKRALVDEFVAHAALAIAKDWLQQKRQEVHQDYSRISRMLSEMTDRLKGPDALRGIFDVVTRQISEIVRPEIVSIFLYNEATGLLEDVAELRADEPVDTPEEVYRPGQSLTGSVFKSEETIQLPRFGDASRVKPLDDSRYDHLNKEEYLMAIPSGTLEHYLGVPIRIGGTVRGVLRVMNKRSSYYQEASAKLDRHSLLERGFGLDERNVMEIVASHLAVAIRNAELLREKDRQVDQVRTLGEVGRLISSRLNIDELLKLTIRKMAEVMQAEICMLFLKEGERIVLKQSFGMPVISDAYYKIGEGVTGRVAETGEPRLIVSASQSDGKYDPAILAFLAEKHGEVRGIESMMVVPIIAKSTILGVLKVINKVDGHLQYGDSDLDLFRTFADYVGVAIENAQIYRLTNDRLAIAERNAVLSLLVQSVAHEINNTSGVIPANVACIREQLGTPNESIERMLALIEDVASQATEFANEIAGFSFTRSGERQALDVNKIIQSAVEELKFDLRRYQSRLDLSLGARSLVCEMYQTPFKQIVRNVVLNAFQALEGKEGGFIRVSTLEGTAQWAGVAIVEFEDNGPGIKPNHITRIFDPDFTTRPKGNGLGLWLVRTQLEVIGGTIEVESNSGQGAKFIVRIPLALNERSEPA